jgi:alcohol dehydrogenase class IV
MTYLAKKTPERMAVLTEALGGPAADRVRHLIAFLGLPQHIADYGVGEAELRRAADELAGKYPAEDLLEIYVSAL